MQSFGSLFHITSLHQRTHHRLLQFRAKYNIDISVQYGLSFAFNNYIFLSKDMYKEKEINRTKLNLLITIHAIE